MPALPTGLGRRPRGQEAHLPRPGVPRSVSQGRATAPAWPAVRGCGDRTVISSCPTRPVARGAHRGRGRARARRRSRRPGARPRARLEPRQRAFAWRSLNYDEDEVAELLTDPPHRARPLRRRRAREPALRRLLLDPSARPLGAREGRPAARGGGAHADLATGRGASASPTAAGSRVGMPADVVVFDPATVGAGKLRRVHDLPAGADRLVADATGIDAVIVNGVRNPSRRPRGRRPARRATRASAEKRAGGVKKQD